jgi:hypothetical protein
MAIHDRHLDVEQDHADVVASSLIDGLTAVPGFDDAVTGGLEPTPEDSAHRRTIVGDKDERKGAAVWGPLHGAEL